MEVHQQGAAVFPTVAEESLVTVHLVMGVIVDHVRVMAVIHALMMNVLRVPVRFAAVLAARLGKNA